MKWRKKYWWEKYLIFTATPIIEKSIINSHRWAKWKLFVSTTRERENFNWKCKYEFQFTSDFHYRYIALDHDIFFLFCLFPNQKRETLLQHRRVYSINIKYMSMLSFKASTWLFNAGKTMWERKQCGKAGKWKTLNQVQTKRDVFSLEQYIANLTEHWQWTLLSREWKLRIVQSKFWHKDCMCVVTME